MKKLILALAMVAMAGTVWAGEKEELQIRINALTWEMQYMQVRGLAIQAEAKLVQERLGALLAKEKAEAEKKEAEKKVEKKPEVKK